MPQNALGNFIRERRVDLGLSQEQLAERISPMTRQAEVSRLERGYVTMPRRERMEHIAAALEVSLGSLLQQSGWLTDDERDTVDADRQVSESLSVPNARLELQAVRGALQAALDQLAEMELRLPSQA